MITWRGLICLATLALLSACGATSQAPPALTVSQQVTLYQSRAKPMYAPPGPPEDPWGPYINEAATRFDVPTTWVREVMRVESGGYQYRATGTLTTSPVGAMGLMQVMPDTYADMQARYHLGNDAYEPHDNILAGTAYIRAMYEIYGTPGFLAAYNAGPARLDNYLFHNRPLPDETRHYVAMIGPNIAGIYPHNRAPSEQLAINLIPINIPAGPRYVRLARATTHRRGHSTVLVRYAVNDRHAHGHGPAPIEVAEAPATPRHGLRLIASASASEAPTHGGPAKWGVQVGAFGSAAQAKTAAGNAHGKLGGTGTVVATYKSGGATLYRARVSGLTHDAAIQACQKLARGNGHCLIVSPAASS